MQNVALITGASSGIGKELARIHASKGGDVIITARRGPLLEALRRDLIEEFNVKVRVFEGDLSAEGAGQQLAEAIIEEGIEVDLLINNAGFGGLGEFADQPAERYQSMIAVNIAALTELTRAFLPGMIERGRGKILMVGSVAGFVPGPYQAVYFATKAYVLSLTEALAHELKDTPITVTCLAPGPVDTAFAKVAGSEHTEKKRANAEKVAKKGYNALMQGKLLCVSGFGMKMIARFWSHILPRKMIAGMVAGAQKPAK